MKMEATCSRREPQCSHGKAVVETGLCLLQRSKEHVAQGHLLEADLVQEISE